MKENKEKKWLTLNSLGKRYLRMYVLALSPTDVTQDAVDYLEDKGLIDSRTKYKDLSQKDRVELARKCLTDAGIETVKHYIPNFFKKG